MVQGKLFIYIQMDKFLPIITHHIKHYGNRYTDIMQHLHIFNFIRKIVGINLDGLWLGNSYISKVIKMNKKIIHKLHSIHFKIFCVSKAIIKKMKRQHTEWEKIIAKNTLD